MKVLLFAAHGSRKVNSNLEVSLFFEKVLTGLGNKIDRGICCFLQFGKPGIEEALEEEIKKGGTKIYIFPYFLFNGAHVTEDLPEIQKKFSAKYPKTEIIILNSLADAKDFDLFLSKFIGEKI
ncbi:MAG: CbiX/SirB N-terminal domain-containing protein [Desulforegulaceae bacterium]|nr:CbiX/SirB N-terminal domain-containing protein [Desulforegulaceae bacterium]